MIIITPIHSCLIHLVPHARRCDVNASLYGLTSTASCSAAAPVGIASGNAVIRIVGIPASFGSARICRIISGPSITGIIRSVSTISARRTARLAIPSLPLIASATS
jgi:hypothetical protein